MAGALLHTLGAVAALAVGLLFVAAAFGKLRHRALLPAVVANYRILPRVLIRPVATVLPWAELTIGALLLIGGTGGTIAAGAAALLLLVFAAAMAVNLRRGRNHIDCGCGFGPRQPLHRALVYRNLALASALLPRLLAGAAPTAVELLVALPAALAALALLAFLEILLTLPRRQMFVA